MPLLPRSRSGTWLLAGAVWLAVSAGWWWVLPVVPRAVMTLPIGREFLGFGPNHELGLVGRYEDDENSGSLRPAALELIAVPSGRTLATLLNLEPPGYIFPCGHSSDGRIWVVKYGDFSNPRHWVIDLEKRSARLMPLGKLAPDPFSVNFSGDGRYWALVDAEKASLVLWDLEANQRHAVLEGLQPPLAFSRDGRHLAAIVGNEPTKRIRVLDIDSLSPCTEFDVRSGFDRVRLSNSGRYVTGEVGLNAFFSERPDFNPICIELCAGSRMNVSGLNLVNFASNEDTAIGQNWGLKLEWRNLASGETKSQIDIEAMTPWSLSPDHRLVFVPFVDARSTIWQKMLTRIGLNWTIGREGNVGVRLFDANTGTEIGTLPPQWERAYVPDLPRWMLTAQVRWSPDSNSLATCEAPWNSESPSPLELENWHKWEIWDIPPRKSLRWFAAGAALLAATIALLARRRIRKLMTA